MRISMSFLFGMPRLVQFLIDLGISALALVVAYVLRFEGPIPPAYLDQLLLILPIALGLRVFARQLTGLHQQLWRYVSMSDALDIAGAVALGSLALAFTTHYIVMIPVPFGVIAHDMWLNMAGYIGVRICRRSLAERHPNRAAGGQAPRRVLLIGAGQAGNLIAKEALQHPSEMEIVGFIDDDRTKRGSRVQGLAVLGTTAEIPRLVSQNRVDELLLCIPSASKGEMQRIMDVCRESHATVKTIPGLRDLITGTVELGKIRVVQIEDLLNRDPIVFDRASASRYLTGAVVMVTGAGGSIGSELCRQIATLGPSRLILVGRGEFSIYSIDQELREMFSSLDLVSLIADVRDVNRMSAIFSAYAPDVIFHAAAHKHVPLMERNPAEAVVNNVLGTRNVAELAARHNAAAFVLVSTDKAVNPTNVMGATKRVAEMIVQELATRSTTRFMSVRFGNVLGSRGSVIPLFKRQIAQGGPITITHPDIIRYFMTIPEAAQLVLQAGTIGKGGEVFVLDMGDPVKIVDLARDMIRLSGLEPDVDVKIRFTGLRPGEKLYEELLTAEEGTTQTLFKKIMIARPDAVNREKLELGLALLQTAATAGDDLAIRRGLQALVNTYSYQAPGDASNAPGNIARPSN